MKLLLLFRLFLTSMILLSLVFAMNNHFYQRSFAHNFFVNNDAAIVTLVKQIKAETELVNTNYFSNNYVSAQVHAKNAAELINELDDNMTEASLQQQPSSSSIDQIYENGHRNSTTLALVIANIVDEILRNYGVAFDIGYDLTNMSNMGERSSSASLSHSMNMTTFQNSTNSTMLEGHSNMSMMTPIESNLDLVSIYDHETSQVLANIVNEIFEEDLRPQSSVSETMNVDRLERNLKQLEHAIINKASPETLMEIVHVQIHPTLQLVYDLELLGNAVTEG
jgi:hypothetical protein